MTHTQEYEDGFRDGRLQNLEQEVKEQWAEIKSLKETVADVNKSLSKSIRGVERVFWILFGMVALIQFFPYIAGFIRLFSE